MIETTADNDKDLTIITCKGSLSRDEIVQTIQAFYQGSPTTKVMWDMTEADVSSVLSDDVGDIATFVAGIAHSRSNGKTALVAQWDATFGMSRMYQSWADAAKQTTSVQVFRNVEEAMSWLDG